jgi:pimeloyl-ACP methyl ester carboxylesterase
MLWVLKGVALDIVNENVEMGVVEQSFTLATDHGSVPGIMWFPEGSNDPRPTILIGHGGTQHKRALNVLALARRFVRHLGFAAVALDAPGHGDRITDPEDAERRRVALQARLSGERSRTQPTFSTEESTAWIRRTELGGAEWRALLDDLDAHGAGRTYGYWGVSMGTLIGLPFVASDSRVSAAVLGLAGLGSTPGGEVFGASARSLRVPILFVFQWDDELMTRESGLALFDAIGSAEKTMHVHPGGHIHTPLFERSAYQEFFHRHLGTSTTTSTN